MNMKIVFPSLDLSDSEIKSLGIYTNDVSRFGMTLVCSGSPKGLFKVQASNDDSEFSSSLNIEEDTWVDLPNMSQSIVENATIQWTFSQAAFRWVRIVWIKSSGTGAIDKLEFAYL